MGDKGYERTVFRNTNTKYFINIRKCTHLHQQLNLNLNCNIKYDHVHPQISKG